MSVTPCNQSATGDGYDRGAHQTHRPGDVGFVLELPHDRERVRGPDIAVVATERLPGGRVPQGFVCGAPDLAVEVVSPSDNPVELQRKVRDYLEAGTRLVWVVAPEARTATVYRAGGSAQLLTERDSLQGEDVLPDLTVPLAAVLPAPMRPHGQG